MIRRVSIGILILGLCIAATGKDLPASQVELAAITERGRMLYAYDEATWHATDAVLAMKPAEGQVKRYIGQKTAKGWVVAFGRLNESRDRFLVAYEAIEGKSPKEFEVTKFDPPRQDEGFNVTAAKAIDTALKDFRGESRPYNAAVLPGKSPDLYVYVLPAQTTDGVYPLGGDVRYSVSADGEHIIEKRQLHKTILEFKSRPEKPMVRTEGSVHTHVLSDVPEDTDVFHVLTRKPSIPEYVGTKKYIYVIATDGTIASTKY